MEEYLKDCESYKLFYFLFLRRMWNFWKSRLRKWISIVASMVLLLSSIMPTVPVFGAWWDDWEAVWEYIYNEASWNASYQNGGLKLYYAWADWASPYREDLWNTVENRAANWSDIVKNENEEPIYNVEIDGYEYTNCVRNWSGAIGAPEAKYPWAVVKMPKPFAGTVKFVYNGGDPVYPYWEDARAFGGWFWAVSIPAMFWDEFKLDAEWHTTFDPSKLVISLVPINPVSNVSYDYIYDETSFNEALNKANSPLSAYYDKNPLEDRWNQSANRAPNRNDRVYSAKIYSSAEDDEWVSVSLGTKWGLNYHWLSYWEDKYFISTESQVWSDEKYQLLDCSLKNEALPQGAEIPDSRLYVWDSDGNFLCRYYVDVPLTNDECVMPANLPDGAVPNLSKDWCVYTVNGAFVPTGKYVKLLSYSFPGLNPDWKAVDQTKFPWIVFSLPKPFAWTINATYESTTVHPWGESQIFSDWYWLIWVPQTFWSEYALNGWQTTFDTDKFSVSLSQTLQSETSLVAVYPTVACGGNQNSILGWTACECIEWYILNEEGNACVEELVDIQAGTTASAADWPDWVSNDISAIEVVESEDAITAWTTDKVVLQQSDIEDISEGEKTSLATAVTADLVQQPSWSSTKKAIVLWVLDLKFWKVPVDAVKSLINGAILFNRPISVKFKVNQPVKFWVKHNLDSKYSTDLLVTKADVDCTNSVDVSNNAYKGDVKTPVNGEVELWSCGASQFVAYTEETVTPSYSWGGGWWGSSSYSCTNLPDNATANNNTKPTKSTKYSYSTDTSKVCTFQCDKGYTWNEKESKCEKSEVADSTDSTKLDEGKAEEKTDSEWSNQTKLDNGFSQEFNDAYEFAFKNGITTKGSIKEADMYGPLTRIAMAKMLSQYAINVLWKKPANIIVPNFPDVSEKMNSDYNDGVTLSYQLWIMWIWINKFRPFDYVTRAEFGTALSRMLYGLADGEWTYYSTHLQKLMEEKIITNDDPSLQELRGYVMIMLMRSAQ